MGEIVWSARQALAARGMTSAGLQVPWRKGRFHVRGRLAKCGKVSKATLAVLSATKAFPKATLLSSVVPTGTWAWKQLCSLGWGSRVVRVEQTCMCVLSVWILC